MEKIELISTRQFVILCILTFGLYEVWWIYKSWRFFRDKDNLDILPVARTLFSIFYVYALFEKIQSYSKSVGNTKAFSSIGSFIAILAMNLTGYLPDPFWLVSFLTFYFFIPAFESLNFAIRYSSAFTVVESESFNTRQIILMLVGGAFLLLVLIGLLVPLE